MDTQRHLSKSTLTKISLDRVIISCCWRYEIFVSFYLCFDMTYQFILVFIFDFFNFRIIILHLFNAHIFSQNFRRFWSTCLLKLPRLSFSMSVCLSLRLYDIMWCWNSRNFLLRRWVFWNYKPLFIWHWSSICSWT